MTATQPSPPSAAADVGRHWEAVYRSRSADEVSWYEERPATSLRLLAPYAPGAVLDVGAGAAHLADGLLAQGWDRVTLLDVSASALAAGRARFEGDPRVSFVVADLLGWAPDAAYDAWHDRAVFHFLTDPADRGRYVAQVERALRPGGHVVLGAFALDGPDRCSGLPTARYDAAGLAAAFGDGFALVHDEREEHMTPQGVVQQLTWVVLRRR